MSIRAILSDAEGDDERIELSAVSVGSVDGDQLLWIDLEDPSDEELDTLKRTLALPDDTWETFAPEPMKADAFNRGGAIEIILVALADDPHDDPVPLQILVGDVWIVTRHTKPLAFLDEHRERVMDQREVGLLTPLELLISVLDWHLDSFFSAAELLEREVDQLDDAALGTDKDILDRMVRMRRQIARVRRILTPHRGVFAEVGRPDFLPAIDERQRGALVQVQQRLDMAAEAISNAREMLLGTFDVHMTRTAQRTNDIMRVLTLVSVVLLPSVVVAGVMGMNFKVGLFDDPNLFWVVLGVMGLMALTTLLVARWRGWL